MENKTSKYFKYAIGEIILVVIGILIALQINNWNQEKNNEEKVRSILQQIQQDLLNDIQETSYSTEWFEQKEQLNLEFLNGEKPKIYFEDNFFEFSRMAIMAPKTFTQSKQSYLRLKDMIDIVPKHYETIIKKLDRLYEENGRILQASQETLQKEIETYRNRIYDTHNWIRDWGNRSYTEEVKAYFFESDYHNRQLQKFRFNSRGFYSSIVETKNQSLLCYLIIRDLINDTSELPKLIKDLGLDYTKNTIEDFAGTYQFDNRDEKMRIDIKYNVLFMKSSTEDDFYSEGTVLREYDKDSLGFVFSDRFTMKMRRDSVNNIRGFKVYTEGSSYSSIMNKID